MEHDRARHRAGGAIDSGDTNRETEDDMPRRTTKTETETTTTRAHTATFDLRPDPGFAAATAALDHEAMNLNAINTPEDCRVASEFLARVQRQRRTVAERYKARRRPINDARDTLIAQERSYVDPLVRIEANVTRMIQEFRRREAQERAEREAAERRRREDEARREQEARAEELRRAAEAAKTKAVAKMLNKQAELVEQAEPIIDERPTTEEPETLARGVFNRKTYHAAVHDTERLILQVAAQLMITRHGAPPNVAQWLGQFRPNVQAVPGLLMPMMRELNGLASRLNRDLALEGVSAVEDESLVSRGR